MQTPTHWPKSFDRDPWRAQSRTAGLALLLTLSLALPDLVMFLADATFHPAPGRNVTTLLALWAGSFLLLHTRWERARLLLLVSVSWLGLCNLCFHRFFGRYFTVSDITMLFGELPDVVLGIWAGRHLFLLPVLATLGANFWTWRLLRRAEDGPPGWGARWCAALLILVLVIPGLKPLRGRVSEPDTAYGSLRNGAGTLYGLLFRELPLALGGHYAHAEPLSPIALTANGRSGDFDVVVILGESISTSHLSLFGYPLETTPQLQALVENADFLFRPALSGGTGTSSALSLFFNLVNHPREAQQISSLESNLFRLAKRGGYATYFLSTQRSTAFNNLPANDIDHWLDATSPELPAEGGDRRLLDALDEIGLDPVRPNFVVLFQRNAHVPYRANLPEADQRALPSTGDDHADMERQYDQAMRFEDRFLADAFAWFRDHENRPTLIFFTSDHGELFGEDGLYGHNHLNLEVARVPFALYGLHTTSGLLSDLRDSLPAPLTHYEIGKLIAGCVGFVVANPNDQPNFFYLSKTFRRYQQPEFLAYRRSADGRLTLVPNVQ